MSRALWTDRRGATAMLVASALPFVLAATAAAVDVGAIALERRRMQGAVDAAALTAAQDLTSADTRARAVLTANRVESPVVAQIATGSVSGSGENRSFTPGGAGDAVRVSATYPNPSYFIRALGLRFNDATVTAVASRRNLGAISIGSGLAALLSVNAKALGALEASNWQNLSFTKAEIAAHQAKAIATTDGVSNLLATLLTSTQIDVNLLGLGLGVGLPGEGQIAAKLLQAAPALETALFQLLSFAGLSIGTAHVRVDGYRCGKPMLVA
ncbi:pilus assembly protein TadG-related protein [Sphingomonas sp. BT-65]|uniref:pilus assembly protein TadG-related protein n=1 Tax=Sphingomonas sp. BT-65 TaxID=2989821 RepID=UPI0022368A27|nr:pilus assembly protein TadG-related protein [Sphingomonas sp. BT-65]MCW4460208.1 pilus assembly protein TadG-related protein [Sphingomonas sp. BT-65]